ncbi:MAG: hypothetical protein DWQ47_12055 [Acidobacteria bacterium]|nr:MAG: hypothetical protein DWQ32_14470 [Acidobacteriota bacterium]REJ98304.1 MAG: hypothetical protein DWQ38_17270 [Acidobacteriota bacterium]REK17048.1 MAG: hypothetical protein DWQ43_02315 [Acidobacteriota bacterium]REK42958.1 MAG: hypothetical protein DWQ47_12055 [Acidobacteriota bacterium]
MNSRILSTLFVLTFLFAGCKGTDTASSNTEPNSEIPVTGSPGEVLAENETSTSDAREGKPIDSPTEAVNTFIIAMREKNSDLMRATLSEATVRRFDELAKKENKSFYEIAAIDDYQDKMPEVRNEQITGNRATLEIKNEKTGDFDPMPFVKEAGSWKIAVFEQ